MRKVICLLLVLAMLGCSVVMASDRVPHHWRYGYILYIAAWVETQIQQSSTKVFSMFPTYRDVIGILGLLDDLQLERLGEAARNGTLTVDQLGDTLAKLLPSPPALTKLWDTWNHLLRVWFAVDDGI